MGIKAKGIKPVGSTPTDRLLIGILKMAVRDYIYDVRVKDVREFFVSDWFRQIMKHFGSNPDDFRHKIFYYKSYYLKHGTLSIESKRGELIIEL